MTYHDPCYLGRHNGVYDEPRERLRSVPGLELKEMPESRENSFCCGGGGGRIWMETPKGERFSDLRLAQAIGAGAEVLATSCPYCITNFEDSRLSARRTTPSRSRTSPKSSARSRSSEAELRRGDAQQRSQRPDATAWAT